MHTFSIINANYYAMASDLGWVVREKCLACCREASVKFPPHDDQRRTTNCRITAHHEYSYSYYNIIKMPIRVSMVSNLLCGCNEVNTADRVETWLFHSRNQRRVLPVAYVISLYKCETLSVVTLEWSELMGKNNTADTLLKDTRTK